jgi:hypothetical protein
MWEYFIKFQEKVLFCSPSKPKIHLIFPSKDSAIEIAFARTGSLHLGFWSIIELAKAECPVPGYIPCIRTSAAALVQSSKIS